MTDDPTRHSQSLYGTSESVPNTVSPSTGALSFELVGGNIRNVRFGGVEVLSGIQYLVRDRDWGTLTPVIRDLEIDDGDGVCVRYSATCRDPGGALLDYVATIRATPTSLDFTVDTVAIDDVTTNRLGFCVLHPAHLAGAPLDVEHGDGSVEQACFPELIDPWQPFTDIRALTHRQTGITVTCRLDGDTFEMEDQRNWSDASYKTYVRPLAKPWPYVVPAGTRDRQRVSLRIAGAPPTAVTANDSITVEIGEVIGVMPRIGLVVTPDEAATTAARRDALPMLGVQDMLLSFDAWRGHGLAEMTALAGAVAGIDAQRTLELVLAADGDLDAECQRVADHVAAAGLALDAVAVFAKPDLQSTPPGSTWPACPPLEHVYAAARHAFPGLPLGGGMYSYFTELNRKRVPADTLDFVTHATCPIVHAADDLSVMQSLQAVPHILRSARAIYPDLPYRLGPITIGMRQNPYGSRTMPNPDRRRIAMASADPRQDGRFAAAWTIGYAAATEGARLDTLTLGALTGPLGLIGAAGVRPVFEAVRVLASLAGQPRRICRTNRPDDVAALYAGDVLVLSNLTNRQQTVRLGARNIALPPFAVITQQHDGAAA